MHPALTLIAAACIVIAVLLLLSAFQGATYYGVTPQAQLSLAIIILIVAAIIIWMIYKAAQAKLSKIKTGKEALIGSVGVAVTDLKPKGEIRVLGEFWQATAKEGEIKTGEKVEIVGMEGMLVIVKPVKEKLNSLK
jgi:membrane-bound serine protease (ClpP class)